MNPFKIPRGLLEATQSFSVVRNGAVTGSAHGFFCGKDYPSTIQLVENVTVKNGDWLIDSITQQRYYVKDARPIIVGGEVMYWMIKYQTENDYQASKMTSRQTTINIQNVQGNSVIGSQENVVMNLGFRLQDIEDLISSFSGTEKAEAEELLKKLRETEESAHPILVEGGLSKFSNLLKKHSDLLIAVGGWAVQLLIGK